jgi:hypothetical protein
MVSLRSLIVPNEPQCELVSLERVAEVERPIPVEWMEDGPIPVKNAFFEYLQPLIGDLVSYSTVFHQ